MEGPGSAVRGLTVYQGIDLDEQIEVDVENNTYVHLSATSDKATLTVDRRRHQTSQGQCTAVKAYRSVMAHYGIAQAAAATS